MTNTTRAALAALLLLCACGPIDQVGAEVKTITVMEVAGLYTNAAELSQVPQGAMREADNVVFRRPGICETRPGRESVPGVYSEASSIRALTTFEGYLVAWFANNKLARYDFNTQTWTTYTGSFTPPYSLPRVRFMESGGTLYVTTSLGVYRLDEPTADWKLAGVQGAIQSTAAAGAAGFLSNLKSVAYRTHWGRIDANDTLLRGPPGPRLIFDNSSGGAVNVNLRNYIPTTIDTNHFLQIHRTEDVDTGVDPGEEMAQVAEVFPTPTDISNKYLDYIDTTPDELRGPSLYTATEQGLAAEQRPPITSDMVEYNGYTIFARTQGLQTFTLTLLGVGPGGGVGPGIENGEGLTVVGGATRVYRAAPAENVALNEFQRFTAGTASENVANTAASLARVMSLDASGETYAEYVGDGITFPVGTVVIRGRSLATPQLAFSAEGSADHFVPAMKAAVSGGDMSRSGGVVTFANAFSPHGFVVGQVVTLTQSSNPSFPLGQKTITAVVSPVSFRYSEAGGNVLPVGGNFVFESSSPAAMSEPDGASNAYGWSPLEQPDAQPLVNVNTVGIPGSPVLRVIKVGSAVFFIKAEGLYRLFGSTPEDWSLEAWDETRKFLAPETVVVTGGVAYAMTTEGYVRWAENSKPEPASFNIETTIRDLIVKAKTEVDTYGWATVNERDRELYLGLPAAAGDTSATQVFVYSWATDRWARWPFSTFIAHTSSVDGRLYMSRPSDTQLRRLRGAGTSADYQDESGQAISERVVFVPQVGGAPELEKLWTEAEFYFNGNAPSSVSALLTSEQSSELAIAISGDEGDRPGIVTTGIDIEHARCSALTLGLSHAVAQERMEFTGYSATIKSAYRARR